jgi:hypothetical protein
VMHRGAEYPYFAESAAFPGECALGPCPQRAQMVDFRGGSFPAELTGQNSLGTSVSSSPPVLDFPRGRLAATSIFENSDRIDECGFRTYGQGLCNNFRNFE